MDSSYTCCDMGLFDFFRRSSRSRSKTTANDTVTTTTTTSSTFTSATASNVSDASMVSVESVSMSSTSVSKSSSSAAYSLRHSMPEAPQLKESATSLDSTATTASVESNNDDNDQDDTDALPDEPRAMINNYEIVRELGRGATAVVQLGKLKDGDQLVALKVFKTSLLKKMREVKRVGRRMVVSTALDKVQVEIAIMKKLQHRNLLNLLGVFDDDSETLVLMLEYAKHGQIMQWDANDKTYRVNPKAVPDSTSGVFDEDSLRVCVRQLLLGLEYLHENNICHRDLKPENILLGDDGVYKIADFGVAHLFDEEKKPENETAPLPEKSNQIGQPPASAEGKKKGIVSSTAGTYAFMGPETLKGKEYSAYDADVWALGITVYALVFGKIPYYHQDVMELFEMIENQPLDLGDSEDNNNNSGSSISEGLTSLLRGMLEKNPETRWSLKQCKQHEWVLQGLDDKAKREFLDVQHEQVTVDQDEVMRAVTRVTSMNVLMRVQLGASKWKRKAMKSLEIKKRASLSAPPTIDEDSASERLSVASSYSERSSFDVRGLPATTAKVPAATSEDNQLEL